MAKFTEEDINNATEKVLDGILIRRAAKLHGIPTSTLRRRLLDQPSQQEAHAHHQKLSPIQKDALVKWVLQ